MLETVEYKVINSQTGEVELSTDAYSRHQRIVGLRNIVEKSFLAMGEELYYFEKDKQYVDMGYETFNAYLADPEVNIERGVAFKLKGVYETFVLGLKVELVTLLPAGYSKLDRIRPHVDETNVDEWVNKASSLSRSDLIIELREAFPSPPPPPIPEGKYRVIYADPPWKYTSGDQHAIEEQDTVLGTHYPSMTIQELCQLPIADMAHSDAVLFMWVTSPLLEECFDVINAWGFKYKTSIIWNKEAHNVGHYVSVRHEFLLICTRGSCKPDIDQLLPSVISERRTEHSVKPEIFRKMIDTMYPNGNRIELFARRPADGWKVWGNEL